MVSISIPPDFNNKIHQQDLSQQEKGPAITHQSDLPWWRRLLTFIKNLFDRIFNRNQEPGQPALDPTTLLPNRDGIASPILQQNNATQNNSTNEIKILSDNELNNILVNHVILLSKERNSTGFNHIIEQLNKILSQQMAPLLRAAANDPHVSLTQDMQEQLNNLDNGRRVLCFVSRADIPALDIVPISLEDALLEIINKSQNNRLQDMANDMFKTLQITQQAFHIYHIHMTHDLEHKTAPRPPILYRDDKKRLLSLVKDRDIIKNAGEIFSITVESFARHRLQQAQDRIQGACIETFPKACDIFKEQLQFFSNKEGDPSSLSKLWRTTIALEHCSRTLSTECSSAHTYAYLVKPFIKLLTLNIETPIDQINKEDLTRVLDEIARATRQYKIRTHDNEVDVPREYMNLTSDAIFAFMPNMFEQEEIPWKNVLYFLFDAQISKRTKWWIPQELMERFEQNIN